MPKPVIHQIINIVRRIYGYNTHLLLKRKLNIIYSMWVQTELKDHSGDIYVEAPAVIKGGKNVSIGRNFSALRGLRIECWEKYFDQTCSPVLKIGDDVFMNYNVHIGCINKISIGNRVLLASNIYITDHHHGTSSDADMSIAPFERLLHSKGPVIIEDNVWIGENAVIMPNVVIGKGSIVGANSVVTKSCRPYSVIAGVPAKIIRENRIVPEAH